MGRQKRLHNRQSVSAFAAGNIHICANTSPTLFHSLSLKKLSALSCGILRSFSERETWYQNRYKFPAVNFQELPSLVQILLMVLTLYGTCNSRGVRIISPHNYTTADMVQRDTTAKWQS